MIQERSSSSKCPSTQDRGIAHRNSVTLIREKKFLTKNVQTDINNNEEKSRLVDVELQFDKHLSFENPSVGCTTNITAKRSRGNLDGKSQSQCDVTKTRSQVTRFTETGECTCTTSQNCRSGADCGYFCCGNHSRQPRVKYANVTRKQDPIGSCASLSRMNSVQSCSHLTKKTIDAAYVECCVEDVSGCLESWKKDLPIGMCEASDKDKKLQSYTEHLEKCKELLGECGLKNVNGFRVNNTLDHARGVGVTKSPRGAWKMPCRMEDQRKTEKRGTDSHCSLKCSNDCPELPPISTNSTPLLITNDQGLVEIHILSLQLATTATAILFQEESLCNVSLFISWNIWGQETVCTPCLKCPQLNFNSSFVYHIPDLCTFFNCVLSEYVIFQANVVKANSSSYSVARAKLCIKDILDYPQNKLHYIAPMNSVMPCTLGMNFGQLSLWVRLSCDVEQVESFKKQRGLLLSTEQFQGTLFQGNGPQKNDRKHEERKDKSKQKTLNTSEKEERARANVDQTESEDNSHSKVTNVDLKHSSRISLSTDGSADSVIPIERKSTPEALKWEKTESEEDQRRHDVALQDETSSIAEFNSFIAHRKFDEVNSTILDMLEVFDEENWNNYKRKSFGAYSQISKVQMPADHEYDENDPSKSYPLEKDTIVIEIANVTLFENSSVMRDDEVHLLYVEYAFLGYRGADMETESRPKPQTSKEKLVYHFRKTFHIDEQHHSIERNTLRAMLDQSINPNIKFILVSEPLPEETDSKDCVEIGYAYFNIRKYALGDNSKILTLPIVNQDRSERVGVLQIYVLGLDAIRKCLGEDL